MNCTRNNIVTRFAWALAIVSILAVLANIPNLAAQSVLGSISGTVSDSTGAVIPGAAVLLVRTETNTQHSAVANESGKFLVLNLEPGTYDITTSAAGFGVKTGKGIVLIARQQLRYDISLSPTEVEQKIVVTASDIGTIETQTPEISAALTPREVLELPANYRGAGSTSPISVIQTLPGVQPDTASYPPAPSTHPQPSLKFSLQGGLPSQTEVTVDGISAQNTTNNNIQADAFPSAESISEIRVDGVNNNAEYGQPGEITTVTKSGTNKFHGSIYEDLQNQALDATPYGADAATKPHKVANDFGVSAGGPVVLPHIYNGSGKTFFYAAYEGLRYPQTTILQARVPTAAMKAGDFEKEVTKSLANPFTGGTYANATVPINASSKPFLEFYPDPNVGPSGESLVAATAARGYNYLASRRDNINSNQMDFRGDRNFAATAALNARYTMKNVDQVQPADLVLPYSTAYTKYQILASTFTYTFSQKVANEVRYGFTLERDGLSNPFNGSSFLTSTGLKGVSPAFFNGIPYINFNTVNSVGERLGYEERSRIFQYVDNLSWQQGNHLFRFGGDIRSMVAHTEAGGSTVSANYGNFYFNATAATSTGDDFADLLIGVPMQSQTSTIAQDNNGLANAYNVYAQDTWQATHNLTLSFGVRYELHPGFRASNGLVGNFDPSVAQTGRLIYPDGKASTMSVQELANVNACSVTGFNNPYATNKPGANGVACTPVVSNSQAGLPASLRDTPKLRFMPRLGFTYRPFGDEKTAIRGGAGYYNITTTGALFYALAQVLQSNMQSFSNSILSTGGPAFSFPNTNTNTDTFVPSLGSVYFYATNAVRWHDPYSLQTNLSIDRDLGHNTGLRVSYVGMHTWHLVWQPQLNQMKRSSKLPYWDASRASEIEYPNFYQITTRTPGAISDYRALETELSRHFAGGFSFDSTYTWAKNLADNQGSYGSYAGSSFVDEQGGYSPTDSFNARQDYGNVSATRRNRWLSTAVYELPFGHGKRFGANMNHAQDIVFGGWQLSNIFVMQGGTYLSAFIPAGYIDPSGTGSGSWLGGAAQRRDIIANPNKGAHTRDSWLNKAAFACPGQTTAFTSLSTCDVGMNSAPIGRFGTEAPGSILGPGTISLSSGLSKKAQLAEGVTMDFEASFTNVLNHTNLTDPVLDLTQADFGKITASRGSDFGGNRTGQLALKIEF